MTEFSRQFGGQPEALKESRDFLNEVLAQIGWEDREIDLQLAIGEVMQNVIRYGFEGGRDDGIITIDFQFEGQKLSCSIRDNAPASNPDEWMLRAAARRPNEGRHGLRIIEAIADSYEVIPSDDGNTSKLVFSENTEQVQ